MAKKIFVLAAVALIAVLGKAEFLYWQVNGQGNFTSAQLYAVDGDTKTALGNQTLAQGVSFSGGQYTGDTIVPQQTNIDGYVGSQYSFFVELITYASSGEGIAVAWKTELPRYSYDDLLSNGYISAGGIGTPTAGMIAGGLVMGAPVPEPTSGVLLLVGGALLSLRRRRRAV